MKTAQMNSTSRPRRSALFQRPGTEWLAPVQLSAVSVASKSADAETLRAVAEVLSALEPDEYLEYMLAYYRAGLEKYGRHWGYTDLLTALYAAASLIEPAHYLEIGVRRGRSLAVVAAAAPNCTLVGFDLWMPNYAGMPNPGPDFVRSEIRKTGHKGALELISGDSHQTVPAYLAQHPDMQFDLVNVDGDHSEQGARADLATVLPRIRLGGVIALDDIVHPQHRYLENVWDELVGTNPAYSSFKYRDLGYGTALAIRRG